MMVYHRLSLPHICTYERVSMNPELNSRDNYVELRARNSERHVNRTEVESERVLGVRAASGARRRRRPAAQRCVPIVHRRSALHSRSPAACPTQQHSTLTTAPYSRTSAIITTHYLLCIKCTQTSIQVTSTCRCLKSSRLEV